MTQSTPKNPLIATLLSVLLPGAGQLYNRQPNKTILFYAALLLLPIIFVPLGGQYYFAGFAAFTFLIFTLYLLNIGDAFLAAAKIKTRERPPVTKWPLLLLLSFLGMNVYALAGDRDVIGVRAFVLPTNSMATTLETGDRIIVKMNHDKTLAPSRGEVVMFRHQQYPFLIKRIIAVGGEIIEGRKGKVYLNGNLLDEPYAYHVGRRENLDDFNLQHQTNDFGPIIIPDNHFFVMGDNRDNSFDSRDPAFGLLKRDDMKGKPLYIYWAKDKARIGKGIK
ncbi:MAG: signal peptidase I [bacterium]